MRLHIIICAFIGNVAVKIFELHEFVFLNIVPQDTESAKISTLLKREDY